LVLTGLPFDGVFSGEDSNACVYKTAVKPLVKQVLAGLNGCVLVYGQTSSGKTFTISNPQRYKGE
jgi:type II secretory ATPase GspE/PulE/Tfp pilus assembly ATPase PilB-like protein